MLKAFFPLVRPGVAAQRVPCGVVFGIPHPHKILNFAICITFRPVLIGTHSQKGCDMGRKVRELTYGDYVSGRIKRCHCGELFVGRGIHCTPACKQKAYRERRGEEYREWNRERMRERRK